MDGDNSPLGGDFKSNPYPVLAQHRQRCPVSKISTPNGNQAWLVATEAEARAALRDKRLRMRSAEAERASVRAIDVDLLDLDGDDHLALRRLAAGYFSENHLETKRVAIRKIANDLARALPSEASFDLAVEFAHPFPLAVMATLMGIPAADADQLDYSTNVLFSQSHYSAEHIEASLTTLNDYFMELVKSRHGGSGDDLISVIVNDWNPDSLSYFEVVSLCSLIFIAGYENVQESILLSLLALTQEPETFSARRSAILQQPELVEEFLRIDTSEPFASTRFAREAMTLGGEHIQAGERVLVALAAANRDPSRFDAPDEVRLQRDNARRHLTFGFGPHACIGASLARIELQEALVALFSNFTALQLDCDVAALKWSGSWRHRRIEVFPVRGERGTGGV